MIEFACSTKGNLFKEFEDIFSKVYKIDELVKKEREKYGIDLVVCHHDTWEPNLLFTEEGDFYLIDWEFTSLNDPLHDIMSLIVRYDYTKEERDYILKTYYGRPLTDLEYRHAMGQSIIIAYYWISWSLFKGSIDQEDAPFFLIAFRYIVKNSDDVINSYKVL